MSKREGKSRVLFSSTAEQKLLMELLKNLTQPSLKKATLLPLIRPWRRHYRKLLTDYLCKLMQVLEFFFMLHVFCFTLFCTFLWSVKHFELSLGEICCTNNITLPCQFINKRTAR